MNPFGETHCFTDACVYVTWTEVGRDPWLQAIHTATFSGEMGGGWVEETETNTPQSCPPPAPPFLPPSKPTPSKLVYS